MPVRWWLQGGLFVASFWVAMVVAIPEPAAWGITAVLLAALVAALRTYGGARIVVEQGWLRAGRAQIELKFVGPTSALDPVAARALSGPLADARAFLLLRPYLSQAVRIDLNDPGDPAPYWLISCRNPTALVAAIHDEKQGSTGGGDCG